jgi:glycosyltransferase involved in cell wall biosynthesis
LDRFRVGIVIPAFNESDTIGDVIKDVRTYGIPIVVDDGSIDATAEIAKKSGAHLVYHSKNLGYDEALNSGFKKAADLNVDIIITYDADGQHNQNQLQNFIDAIDEGNDVVVGIRNKKQRISEYLFAWLTKFKYEIEDPLCGMKAYRLTVYNRLGYFDSYKSIGTELTLFAAANNFKIKQLQCNVNERKGSSRFGKSIAGNYKILRSIFLSKFIRNFF